MFFKAYPELAANPFFIAGESYAGVYVPTLANAIRVSNAGGANPIINLQGILVGNGCTGNDVGICSGKGNKIIADYLFGVNLYSPSTHALVYASCADSWENPSPACGAALQQMGTDVGNVDAYDILEPCIIGDGLTKSQSPRPYPRVPATHPFNTWLRAHTTRGARFGGPNECIDGITAGKYLNTPEVRDAIHVIGLDRLPQWSVCVGLNYTSNIPSLYPEPYLTLIQNFRVLIFNGDHDACVPVNDNELWTAALGLAEEQPWHPWLLGDQVAGYTIKYNANFSFATVKGAGHMVPQYKPVQAYQMFVRFLSNVDL